MLFLFNLVFFKKLDIDPDPEMDPDTYPEMDPDTYPEMDPDQDSYPTHWT